jgi:integrase
VLTRHLGNGNRLGKIEALRDRAGSEGERKAAGAAIERVATVPAETGRRQQDKLTDALIRKLLAPATGNRITYDASVKGFGVRVTAAGARAFILNYRRRSDGLERRATIGAFPDWSVSTARDEAKRLKRLIDGGGDPVGEHREQMHAPTMNDLCDRFEQEHLPRKRASTAADYRSMIRAHVRPEFGKRKVAALEFADIDALHRAVTRRSGPYRANRVLALLSKMFSLAMKWKLRADNPCRGVERNDEAKRKRYLTEVELRRLKRALAEHDDRDAADIFHLLLLTGARRGEVLAARWGDFDLEKGVWTKPGSTTKQRTIHVIPLSPPAVALLKAREKTRGRQEYVFPGRRGGHRVEVKSNWRRLCKAAKITGLRIHDLRHSFASVLASDGVGLPVIGALLGHTQPSTTARYSHIIDTALREATGRVGVVVAGRPARGRES